MFRARGSTGQLPTWEALEEPSIVSGDGGSDTDEVDQIRATPALQSDRPVYKRKESDWTIESVPKRAKHEQPNNLRQVKPFSVSTSDDGALCDSVSDGARPGSSAISSGSSRPPSSMVPPPLPSRVSKDIARNFFMSGQPSSKNQSILSARPSASPTTPPSSSFKSNPNRPPLHGKDIPSALDSTLFSNVSAKRAAQSHSRRSSNVVPNSNDVIEVSSESSDTSPPSKGKDKATLFTPSSRTIKGKGQQKISTATRPEVIEILDSDDEEDVRRTSTRSMHTSVARVPPFTLTRKSGTATLSSSAKTPVQDVNVVTNTTRPAANPSSNSSASPTQPRFPQIGTSSHSSVVTGKASNRNPLSASHSRQPSGTSNVSEKASKTAGTSGDGDIDMRDLDIALGIPPPSKKGKSKEETPSTLLNPMRKQRLFARKSVGGRPPPRQIAVQAASKSAGALGCSAASVIDLTGDASDEDEASITRPSKTRNSSTSNTAKAKGQPFVLSPSPPQDTNLVSPATVTLSKTLPPESSQLLLEDALTQPPVSGSTKASEAPNLVNQIAPTTDSVLSSELQPRSSEPNILTSTDPPPSAELPHMSGPFSTPPPSIAPQTTLRLFPESARSAESGSSSSSSSPNLELPSLPDQRNPTQPFSHVSSDVDETRSQASSQLAMRIELNVMRLSSETEEVAERLLGGDESDDPMQAADELDVVAGDNIPSMEEEPPAFDDGMWIDNEAGHPLEALASQTTIKATRMSVMSMKTSSDSGVDASSEPGLGVNSPVSVPSVPSTRRSSRLSLYSNASEGGEAHRRLYSMPSSRSTSPDDADAFRIQSRTLGGFPAYRFELYRKDPKNFPKVYHSADLPSSIQDHINSQPEQVRMLGGLRDVFEAMILENTADDERDAPPVAIQNDVDDEPTPPWEFWYSNKMWHGNGVPDPDMKNLKGCDCRGACNPRNKACACAQRQSEVVGDSKGTEFAYDKNGRLKYPGFPIFECNNTCWCGPECTNRVVQHGRKVQVTVRKTADKGWGVFNGSKKIPRGTFIGIYAGELLTDEEAHLRGLKYNKAGTTYLFDLDFHHLKDGADEDWTNLYTVDAYHAGNFTRFLNHSCNPNCRLYACYINEGDIQKPLLTVFSIRDIEPEEEICFNYQGIYPGEEDDDDETAPEEENNEPKDKIYRKCLCGAKNCRGVMFS